MQMAGENIELLIICGLLTLLAATVTVILSAVLGATLAFHSRPTLRYALALGLMFVPFAIGSSVWAYSATRLASWSGLQGELLASGMVGRATALLLFCLARTVPLGIFFCATTLHRHTSGIRPYLQTHRLNLPFVLLCGMNRIPKSTLMLLGLFGGALMASEASLPTFLYRANPGTGPETANILLFRLFRETYATSGPESLSRVATLGVIVSLALFMAALFGTWAGRGILVLIRAQLSRSTAPSGLWASILSIILRTGTLLALVPGVLALAGLLGSGRLIGLASADALQMALMYWKIVILGIFVAGTITIVGIAVAVRLRYSRRDLLALLETKPLAASALLLPAFVPVLSVVALLGGISDNQMAGAFGYSSLFMCHVALHFPVFLFICMSLIAAIPEHHVMWQRAMKVRYFFSLVTDGFKRHAAVTISLIGLGTVLVVTDGAVSRWFTYLVKSPEEAFYAAMFGRLSSAAEAMIIAWSVAIVALAVCTVLAAVYVRELKGRSHNV
jgi:hypothetical protein